MILASGMTVVGAAVCELLQIVGEYGDMIEGKER
jgi:hypothetical protein